MAVRLKKVASVERHARVLMDRATSAEARSKRLAEVAREQLTIAETQNALVLGHVPEHVTIVDGRVGASEDTVKPDGRIVYEFNTSNRAELLNWILTQLRKFAPVLSGRFRDSIRVYADAVEVSGPLDAVDAETITFVATTAYARKLEGQRDASGALRRPPLSPQAPNGIFHAVATLAETRQWSKLAKVQFTFADVRGGNSHLEQWASGRDAARRRMTSGGNSMRQGNKDRRNPAIVVRFR